MSILVRIGSASLGKTSTGAGPETQPERMNLDERMVLRREMAFQVVRYVIGEWGLPEASFRFKVVPLDPRGHIFSVMIDLPVQFMADLAISQRELQRLGGLIDLAARKRFNLRVPSVYWRVSEDLPRADLVLEVVRRVGVEAPRRSSATGYMKKPSIGPVDLGSFTSCAVL
jgi:hypothetical protein